jgi:hypothetical protein
MFFSLKGYFSYITSRELAWGTMTRQGFEKDDDKKDDGSNNSDGGTKEKKSSIFDKLKKKKKSEDFEPLKP